MPSRLKTDTSPIPKLPRIREDTLFPQIRTGLAAKLDDLVGIVGKIESPVDVAGLMGCCVPG